MWYLRRGVVLSKDNLARRNWHGNKSCSFCSHNDTIKHLFFQCTFTRSTWSIIQIASNLYLLISVTDIFGRCWLDGIPNRFKMLIRVEVYALLWSLWLCRNELVLNGKNSSPLQFIFRCTHLLCMWSTHRTEFQPLFKAVCMRLEQVAKKVFTQHG